tara:strand:- start:6397 stop:7050 length:654 start_codon:yes stop_codon:yes gene_type:complete
MSSTEQYPTTGDFVINPETKRPIKVGSRTWNSLVKKGILSGNYNDPNELSTIDEDEEEYIIEQKIKEINKTLPNTEHGVRGRGKFKGKIVKRNKKLSTREISKHTAKVASKTLTKNIDELVESDDMESLLEQMILEDLCLISSREPQRVPKRSKVEKAPRKKIGKRKYRCTPITKREEQSSSEELCSSEAEQSEEEEQSLDKEQSEAEQSDEYSTSE